MASAGQPMPGVDVTIRDEMNVEAPQGAIGENVYSAEVERVMHRHHAVAECVVVGIPSEVWGEQVHAIVRLHDGARATEEELIAHCRKSLAGYMYSRRHFQKRTISADWCEQDTQA